MHSILKRNLFFVKEHIGLFKAANNFDIYDPANKELILECREEKLGFFTKMFRFSSYKRMTPFHVAVKTIQGEKVLSIQRGFSLFLSKVDVLDENDVLIGRFKQRLFTIGGKFDILDPNDQILCTLKGSWTSWNFRFLKENEEYAEISKDWAGLGRELFTTADNYILKINSFVANDDPVRVLILAAVLCMDMVLKE